MSVPSSAELHQHLAEAGGESESHILQVAPPHQHYFVQVKGNEAQCDCSWGVFLSPIDEVREGHVYNHGQKII